MLFTSTRGGGRATFKEAVLRCLPDDGGLYVPLETPDLRPYFLPLDAGTSYGALATLVARHLLRGELDPAAEERFEKTAFPFEPELVRLDGKFSVLKLYHGPTGVFKDFGIAFMAAILDALENAGSDAPPVMVVSAVRGDIGYSIARAFRARKGIINVILCPRGPIVALDEADYVTNGGNTIPVQVDGNLDDCAALIRDLIHDRSFSGRYRVTSINSINMGRLLPQALYFLWAFVRLKRTLSGGLVFSVPSGNLGNLIAGLYAWRFGMPVDAFIAAMNVNNPLGNFLQSAGKPPQAIAGRVSRATAAPALNVSYPVNYERLAAFQAESALVMKNMVLPEVVEDAAMKAALKEAWEKYGVLLDPHGALAFAAARCQPRRDDDCHTVVLATGHPAKYAPLIKEITGQEVPMPERLACLARPSRPIAVIPPQLDLLESAIASCF